MGNSEEISMYELAEKVRLMTASTSEIKLIPYDEAYSAGFEDMQRRVPCTDKIRALIGFVPRISLDQLIHRVIESMRTAV